MDLNAVVLDYDGTIAEHGVLNSEVRSAIDDVRARGIAVVLATGRILGDLHRVVGDLRFVDAVVAENGAVVAYPESGRSTVLASAPCEFVAELHRRGVNIAVGECVVETDTSEAPVVLDVIREMQLPLVLIFNRGRLMILPQGVSKATGLNVALRTLRLSEHNALAIGDAENDHALLAACELGVAVEWGSPALCAVADAVIHGSGPAAVAAYLRGLDAQGPPRSGSVERHRLILGTTDHTREPLSLAVRARNVLISGDPRSGKSWLTGLLCEQLILQHYSVCVVDPEGDYRPLETLPGVVMFGGSSPPPRPYEVARTLRHPDVSMVVDLSRLSHDEKRDYVWTLLPLVAGLRKQNGLPHRIVIDEAHYFVEGRDGRMLVDPTAGGYTLVTYRPTQLPAALLDMCGVKLTTRATEPLQLDALHATALADQLASLSLGEAVLLPGADESSLTSVRFRMAPRLTEHVRHRQKYLDVPVGERLAFDFTDRGRPLGCRARTLAEFGALLAECPAESLGAHLDRSDVSRWVGDVFGDHVLAGRIRDLEQLHRLRQPLDEVDALLQLIDERYAPLDEI